MGDAVIGLHDVGKRYRVYHQRHTSLKEVIIRRSRGVWEEVWALDGLTFDVPAGQMLGVIGHNGAGKSTLLKLLTGILQPDRGHLETRGRVSSLLELGAGFQQEYTGRENIYLNGVLLGLPRREVARHFDEIVAFSELESFIDHPVKNYSTGMRMRLGFAVAVHLVPDILLLDEVLAVGDAAFQQKCFAHMRKLRREGTTVLLVSHDLDSVRNFCERVVWLDHGRVAADGPPERALQAYLEAVTNAPPVGAAPEEAVDDYGKATAEVEVLSVRYLNGAGEGSFFYESGEPMTVEIRCRAERVHDDVGVTLNIVRVDGVHAVNTNSEIDGIELCLPAGESTIELRFPALDLRRAMYDLDLVIYSMTRHQTLAYHHRRHPFNVNDEDGGGGIAHIRHHWRVTGPVVSARPSTSV